MKYKNIFKLLLLETIYLIIIESINHLIISNSLGLSIASFKTSFIFDIIWGLIIISILILLNKYRQKGMLIINIFLLIICCINYFMYSYFGSVFSWKDLLLTGEGLSFVNSIFKFINIKFIIICVILIFFVFINYKCCKNVVLKCTRKKAIYIILIIGLLFYLRTIVQNTFLKDKTDGWDSYSVLNNGANYYNDWINPVRLLRVCGTYEYLFRDLYVSFIKKENVGNVKKEIEEYIKGYEHSDEKNNNGIFKGKNLIYIMMESMDDWLINPEVTPTIYEMMGHGFNFENHYSPGYVTGVTANTEFIVNTGMYPNFNSLSPNYAFVNNKFNYSIANLFKSDDYVVNSFHRSYEHIYNRGNMHKSLGYSKYHNYEMMDISDENLDFDSNIITDGYKKIVSKDHNFMSFIITYTPHSPYTFNKRECMLNLDTIKKIFPNENNEEILCAYSAARETDNMFKELLSRLKNDDLLNDTVIVAFSDHPNNVIIRDDETKKLNKTVFFIYDANMNRNDISTISSSIDILPTVINLFGIDNNYVYPGKDLLNTESGYVIFNDYTYYDGRSIEPIDNKMKNDINYSKNILVSNYYN